MSTNLLYTSQQSGQSWTVGCWDPKNGTNFAKYSTEDMRPRTLVAIGDTLLGCGTDKPQILQTNTTRKSSSKNILPGIPSAIALTPDSFFIFIALGKKIYSWETKTGDLLSVTEGHYQTINCIEVCLNGSRVVSGGDDSLVILWSLGTLLSGGEDKVIVRDHTLPVVDLSTSGVFIASVSLDRTCKVFDLNSGSLVRTISLDQTPTCVFMGTDIFVGGVWGTIYHVGQVETKIRAHEKSVRSICGNGLWMVSGGDDCVARVWLEGVEGWSCVRTIPHGSPVLNVVFGRSGDCRLGKLNRAVREGSAELGVSLVEDVSLKEYSFVFDDLMRNFDRFVASYWE